MSGSEFRLRESVVYFARRKSDGRIKIGSTTDLQERIRLLRSQFAPDAIDVIGTVAGGRHQEAQFHRALADDREDGEWFRPTPRVRAAASGALLKAADADPFDGLRGPARMRLCGTLSRRELREKIVGCFNAGMSGRETSNLLALSVAKLTREVRLMRAEGYFRD